MKLVFAAAAVAVVVALAAPAAHAQSDIAAPPPDPSVAWCRDAAQVHGPALLIPGFGEAIAKCMEHHTMRRDVRNCLIATGITLAGVAVGGVIGGTAARVIAGDKRRSGTVAVQSPLPSGECSSVAEYRCRCPWHGVQDADSVASVVGVMKARRTSPR